MVAPPQHLQHNADEHQYNYNSNNGIPMMMPEPPPPYTVVATAPPAPLSPTLEFQQQQQQLGTSLTAIGQQNRLLNSSQLIIAGADEEEQKFAPSTPFHHQQQQQQRQQQQPPTQSSASSPSVNQFVGPPGTVVPSMSESSILAPPSHGFYPAPPMLSIGPHGAVPMINGGRQQQQNDIISGSGNNSSNGVMNGQIKVIYAVPLGPHEAHLECTNCHQPVQTKVLRRAGLLSWLVCGALALVGCWPCCILPFCVQSCQDAEHYCPRCNEFLGKYSRI